MASACVNKISMSPESFLDGPTSFPWLTPIISKPAAKTPTPTMSQRDPELSGDFEFRLDHPVNILPADELFSDGKLMPLHLAALRPTARSSAPVETRSPEKVEARRKVEISNTDPYLFSPKAPRCSSRWKDLLGLKKLNILHRSSKSTGSSILETSLIQPLLPDTEFAMSARLSLSSSSSGSHDHDVDLPRHSLDIDRLRNGPSNAARAKLARHRTVSSENPTRMSRSPIRSPVDGNNGKNRGMSVDSPRMNSSGRVIFQGLERSSSSPSTFNGGPRLKYKGMERSYSANVRVTPVLNVPVCSLMGGSSKSSVFGFQLFPNSSATKKDVSGGLGNGGRVRGHISRIRTEKP